MKNLIFAIIMLCIAVASCSSPSEDRALINNYVKASKVIQCEVVYLNDFKETRDTSQFVHTYFYVLAKDIPEARQIFEVKLSDMAKTLNGVEVYWKELQIYGHQPYPYN